MKEKIAIHWFRRDLRLNDNAALYHALKSGSKVIPIFIFDSNILSKLENRQDARVQFIHNTLRKLKLELKNLNSDLQIFYGNPTEIWEQIIDKFHPGSAYTNKDYEPYAIKRDAAVEAILTGKNISFHTFKDHVIFEKDEVLKDDGNPYTVYTPYSRKWKLKLNDFYLKSYPNEKYQNNYAVFTADIMPSLKDIGFEPVDTSFPPESVDSAVIKKYHLQRDIPSINGTSRLSLHFRFGSISIRDKAAKALKISEKWLNELIWRDFYIQIMAHFPQAMSSAFKSDYNRVIWNNNVEHFHAWCEGKTGYPLVDAGMRELNSTGFMHNRVRMVVASFLCKHLLIDWKWGEAYFAEKLLDFELASNNGGWQWAAGSGVDAAPYFRIFNPKLQMEKFDPELKYIKKWVPEFGTFDYPSPIVVHEQARVRCLEVYKAALKPS